MIDEEKQLESLQNDPGETLEADGLAGEPISSDVSPEVSGIHEGMTLGDLTDADIPDDNSVGTQAEAASYQAALAEMENELKALKSQLDERTSQCVRIAADFDNYRKRTQREREDLEQQIKCSTINELLPVVDNFERARSQIKPQTEQETTIHKSYQSVYKQLVECLKRLGVAPMRSEGKEFDPNLHEAVMRQPTEEYPEGTVMEELVRGYLLGERVLRHALVKVAAAPDPVIPSEGTGAGESES